MTLRSFAARSVLLLLCLSISAGNALAADSTPKSSLLLMLPSMLLHGGKHWRSSQLIENDNAGDAKQPQIAFDAAGNAIAVWTQYEDFLQRWYIRGARCYTSGSSWIGLRYFNLSGDAEPEQARIAVDGAGNAIVVWQQSDGTYSHIWAARYAYYGGWTDIQSISNNNAGDAKQPQIAFDAAGNAIAV